MTAGQAIQLPVRYAVTKRKIPTGADLVITVNGSSNLTNPGNVAYESDGGFSTNGTLTSQGSCYANLTYKANAEL
jgi:hypothetical protein